MVSSSKDDITVTNITVPLQFYFCRNPGLAFHLLLFNTEVKVKIILPTLAELSEDGAAGSISKGELWVDYIYLDTDERRRFAQQSHEYLIEQLTIPANYN